MAAERPSPPLNLNFSDQIKTAVTLTWETPVSNGGSMITGYIIEKCDDGTDKWLRCNARLCPDLSYRVRTHCLHYNRLIFLVLCLETCLCFNLLYKRKYIFHHDLFPDGFYVQQSFSPFYLSAVSIHRLIRADRRFYLYCASLQVSGLKPGQKYLYRVCAENAAGVSDPAKQVGPLLADDPHST